MAFIASKYSVARDVQQKGPGRLRGPHNILILRSREEGWVWWIIGEDEATAFWTQQVM